MVSQEVCRSAADKQSSSKSICLNLYANSNKCTDPTILADIMQSQRDFKASMKLAAYTISTNSEYKDLTQQQRDLILKRRIQKFFGTNQCIDVSEEHYAERLQPVYQEGVQTSRDTLILFGNDFLSPTALRNMFRMGDPNFEMIYLNPSNCMLRYTSAQQARKAIKGNLKAESQTSFKVEEDIENEPTIPPKEWIELKPYNYRFYYKDQGLCPNQFKDYSRRLFIRYATTQEKKIGKLSLNHIEELYNRCKTIWTAQAEKSVELKKVIELKLSQFKNRLSKINSKNLNGSQIIDQRQPEDLRQRSRNKPSAASKHPDNKDNSIILPNPQEQKKQRRQKNRQEREEMDRDERQSSDLEGLIRHIERINLDCEEKGDVQSILQDLQNLNFDSLRGDFIQIPYKVAAPFETRSRDINGRFKYHDYVVKTTQLEQKMKKFCHIDLTEQY